MFIVMIKSEKQVGSGIPGERGDLIITYINNIKSLLWNILPCQPRSFLYRQVQKGH